MGKPEKIFDLAIKDMNIEKDCALMIGDDILSDIKGSKDFGIKAIQVKTKNIKKKIVDIKITQPNLRIDSIVDIVKLFKRKLVSLFDQ